MRLILTLLFLFILFTIAFIFGSQNDQMLTLNYLIAKTELSVAQAVSLFTGIGIFIGLLISLLWKLVRVIKPKSAKNKLRVKP